MIERLHAYTPIRSLHSVFIHCSVLHNTEPVSLSDSNYTSQQWQEINKCCTASQVFHNDSLKEHVVWGCFQHVIYLFIYFYLCQVKIKLAQSSLNWWHLWGYIKDEKGGWCERNEIKTILGERLKKNHRGVIFYSLMFQWECFMSKCCWHCKSKFRWRF